MTTRRWPHFWLLPGVVALLARVSHAAPEPLCDTRLLERPAAHYGYRQHPSGRYCEGFYSQKTNLELQLVSLTQGSPSFAFKDPAAIRIAVPASRELSGRTVQVRGVGRSAAVPYRMDTALAPGAFFDWDPSHVLGPNRLSAADVGVMAWFQGDYGPVYVPIRVTQGAPTVADSAVYFAVRIPEFAAWVDVRTTTAAGPTPWRRVARFVTAGKVVGFNLAIPREPPMTVVGIKVKLADRDQTTTKNLDVLAPEH